jgi:hypothetical protein
MKLISMPFFFENLKLSFKKTVFLVFEFFSKRIYNHFR